MSQNEVERFLGRLITDANFRARAASSLADACRSEGFSISTEKMSPLGRLNYLQFGVVAETLDEAILRDKRLLCHYLRTN